MNPTRRWLLALCSALLLASCEQQEAVPLGQSVPAAIALCALGLVAPWAGWVGLDRLQAGRVPAPRRVKVTVVDRVVVCMIGLLLLAGVLAVVALVADVAGKYQKETVDVFSWEDTLFLASAVELIVVVVGFLLARFARALMIGLAGMRVAAAVVLLSSAAVQVYSRNAAAIWIAVPVAGLALLFLHEARSPAASR